MRYSGGIVKWSQEELHKLDVDIKKLLTMHGAFCMNSDVDRLYIPRKRGLISVRFSVEHEKRNLSFYVHRSPDLLMGLIARGFAEYQEDGGS